MAFGEVIGYTFNGAVYCSADCLPDGVNPDNEEVSTILEGQGEWDYVPCCEGCDARIEDITLTIEGNRYEAQHHLEAANTLWRTTEQLGNFITRIIRTDLLDHLEKAREHIELL